MLSACRTVGTPKVALRAGVAMTQHRDFSTVNYNFEGGRSSVSGIRATVFGCSGFVGRYVVNRLGRIGSQCILPFRGDGMNVRHLKLMGDLGQMVPLPFDMAEPETLTRTMHRSNVVINLVGNMHQTRNYSFDDTHVKVVHRIAKMAAETGTVDKFIHVSAYGADLNSPSAFLRSKAKGEMVVKDFFPNATILRPTQIFGHEDKFINRYSHLMNISPGVPLIDENQKVQPVFVQDVAQAIVNCVANTDAPGKTYNLAGPQAYTYAELLSMISQETVRPDMFPVPLPHAVARLLGTVVEKTLPIKWRLLSSDLADQMLVDMTVRPRNNGLNELGVAMTPLEKELNTLCLLHSGDRVPHRFETKLGKQAIVPR